MDVQDTIRQQTREKKKKRYTQSPLNNAKAKSIVSLYPATKYQP